MQSFTQPASWENDCFICERKTAYDKYPTTAMNLVFPKIGAIGFDLFIISLFKFNFIFCATVYAQFSRLLLLKKKQKTM